MRIRDGVVTGWHNDIKGASALAVAGSRVALFGGYGADYDRLALRAGIWIPGQRQRLRRLAPGTWNQALASALGASPAGPDDGHLIVEIAIYPDVAWLAARSLRAHGTSDRGAS